MIVLKRYSYKRIIYYYLFTLSHWPYIIFCSADMPTQVPPLTPGTNKRMTDALKLSFASWEKEQLRLGIVKGKLLTSKILLEIAPKWKCAIVRTALESSLVYPKTWTLCNYVLKARNSRRGISTSCMRYAPCADRNGSLPPWIPIWRLWLL